MSDIELMNIQMHEILNDYIEIYSFINKKLDKIKTDKTLDINFQLLKASILDLNINISKIKNVFQFNKENITEIKIQPKKIKQCKFQTNFKKLNNKQLLTLFYLYIIKLDKNTILNKELILNKLAPAMYNLIINYYH